MTFLLDSRLKADTVEVCQMDLCYVGLLNDARYPWLVLVPRVSGLVEIVDMNRQDRLGLWEEVENCCDILRNLYPDCKLNIGALGNIVRQLHIHVVARHDGDAAWPGPVWGAGIAEPYGDDRASELIREIRKAL